MKKRDKLIYRIATGLFTAHMLFTVVIYIAAHDMVSEMFESLGVSSDIIYPLAAAKVLGLAAIWWNKSKILKQLAYLGFAVDFVLAIITHFQAEDGGAIGAGFALVVIMVSYIFDWRLRKSQDMAVV